MAVAQSARRSVSLREADPTDLEPVNRAEFAGAVTPCLQLVAPVGMDDDSQEAWLEAAFVALKGIPIALLKRGAAQAMLTADHPSKVVPAIAKAIDNDWHWRKRYASYDRPKPEPEPPRIPDGERKEVADMIDGLLKKMGGSEEA